MSDLEKKLQAKIPGEDTGIEVRRSVCAICSPGNFCGVDCYVKDGKIIRIEGTPDHPVSKGVLCTKGAALRNHVYREDRIRTPLRRIGERGEGKFEPISWDEALRTIAENLNRIKKEVSPHAVVFFSGYSKWYRQILQRFAYKFGSVNYGSDDSACFAAKAIGDRCITGAEFGSDMANANTFLAWNYDGYYSSHRTVPGVEALKKRGGKVILIDIRETPASKHLADIYLKIRPGTDGALALGLAKIIIDNGWEDKEFIEKYTYGYEQYKELVQQYPLDKVAEITGLNPDDIFEVAKIYATNGPACTNFSGSALVHRINGLNTHRAIFCLSGLTGNVDRPGGIVCGFRSSFQKAPAGFPHREREFQDECCPKNEKRIGAERFPLWDALFDEMQGMDLCRQIEEGTPYPVKAIFGVGMNLKMFPQTERLKEAIKKLDFFVDSDLFMTETTRYADIVLPACSSLERSELKVFPGGFFQYTKPVIPPMYESRSDVEYLCELARVMDIDDDLLKAGYDACMEWIIEGCGLTLEEIKNSDGLVKIPTAKPPAKPGTMRANGFPTPSGKFEFYSNAVAAIDPKYGLDPLPSYRDSLCDQNDSETCEKYPFYMCTGARIAHTLHSSLHETPWLRSLRPKASCEIFTEDAKRLGIEDGDMVEISSPYAKIRMTAMVTAKTQPGLLLTIHGFTEANVNDLVAEDHLDPYTGFPGVKGFRCDIKKCREG